jgi:hypothetical protein
MSRVSGLVFSAGDIGKHAEKLIAPTFEEARVAFAAG